ncbi:unnamed protein product [Closterium sp. Naga37s-1]|nr:unnamed protein product [Closterium sp. Naga37s-1]
MDRSVSARRKAEAPIPAVQESFWSSLVKKVADFVLEDDIPSSRASTPRHQHSPTLNVEDLLGKPVAGSGVSSSPRRSFQNRSSPLSFALPISSPLIPIPSPIFPRYTRRQEGIGKEGIGKVVQVAVDDHPPPRKAAPGSTKPGASARQSAPRAPARDARPRPGREGEVWDTEAAASLVSPASLASPPALVSPASPVSPPSLAARPDEPLASPPPQAPGHASAGPAATSAATSAATLAATSGAELAAEDDLLVRLPKVREMHGGREEGVKRASEAAVHVPKETQLVASRNVATAMAVRAKQLQADLKAARRDAMDARERCRAVEEENERLRAALAAAEAAKGEGVGEREAEGGLEGEGGVDTHHHHHHSELEDMVHEQLGVLLQEKAQLVAGKAAVEREKQMLQDFPSSPCCLLLHEQLGVLLQEKAQLVAGKAAVERENEMLHHLLLYYEHLYLRGGSMGGEHHALAEGGHVLAGGEHVLLEGSHVVAGGHAVGGQYVINQQPGNGEAEIGRHATDQIPEGCAGEGEKREEGQERAEEHPGSTSLQPQVAGEGLLDEARRGSVVGEAADVGGGENWKEGQEKTEEHTGSTSLQQVAAAGSLDEAKGDRGQCGLTEAGGGGEMGGGAEASGGPKAGGGKNQEEGQEKTEEHEGPPSLQRQVAAAVSLDETREGREACGGAEAGGDGMVEGSSDGVRMNGAVSGGVEEERKGGAGSVCAGSGGVDDCTGSKVYAGS